MSSRRDFLCQLGVGAAGALLPMQSLHAARSELPAADAIQFGYAAITWGGDEERAIEDISALGFPGIQLRANVLTRYGLRPAALREQLAAHHLTFVALSSGNVSIDPSAESRVIEEHVSHARFLRARDHLGRGRGTGDRGHQRARVSGHSAPCECPHALWAAAGGVAGAARGAPPNVRCAFEWQRVH